MTPDGLLEICKEVEIKRTSEKGMSRIHLSLNKILANEVSTYEKFLTEES